MHDFDGPETYWQRHDQQGYTNIINVAGTMTGLGASIVRRPVREATLAAMERFVSIHEMQARASGVIAQLTGSEAGCLTASASAAMTLCVAGCMTGIDAGRAEALPATPGPRSHIAVQLGHLCGYGAPAETAIALAGATVRPVGQSTLAMDHQLPTALDENTAAALWRVRDHAAARAKETAVLERWLGAFQSIVGIHAHRVPDPTGNPLERLQIEVDESSAGASAATFARALSQQQPAVIVRNHEVELGYFQLDPCNLAPGQAEMVAEIVARVLADGATLKAKDADWHSARNGGVEAFMGWLGE